MKTSKIFLIAAMALSVFGLQSCLDYDTPSDEFQKETQVVVPPTIITGKADQINYAMEISDEQEKNARKRLTNAQENRFSPVGVAKTGIFALRGGKEGGEPGPHQYQVQFCFGPDNYAQFACVSHTLYPYSNNAIFKSTYHLSKQFNGGPGWGFSGAKTCIAPILNNPDIDSIPEAKAAYLLLYNYAAIENADMFGPLPYNDFKKNREESPFTYDAVRNVYYSAKANIDTCIAAFKSFDNRSAAYKKDVISNLFPQIPVLKSRSIYKTDGLQPWIEFANSLKLRMAIHMAKVEPEIAKQWAEEAVAGGVITDVAHEFAIYPMGTGFSHPLIEISESWNDTRPSASFISLLESLDHPYIKYLFKKNKQAISKESSLGSAPELTPAESVIVGIRNGVVPGKDQNAESNQYISFSKINDEYMNATFPPLYLMKLSEVCFLRAEGALRGWNMGGSAQQFYEEGIRYAYLEDRTVDNEYNKLLDDYMNVTKPKSYTYVDPTGNTPDMPSVTKIPVKWDNSLDKEKKLEMIITQKYIASYPYSLEAWVDLRRTGYPRLFPVLNPQDGDGSLNMGDNESYCSGMNIIRRIPWFSDDPQTLEDLKATGIPALGGPDKQGTRLWWDVDVPNF